MRFAGVRRVRPTPQPRPRRSRRGDCYCRALRALRAAGVASLVGGAYAFARYSGIARDTKDFDLYVRPAERDRALAALAADGFRTEVVSDHWLAKAHGDPYFIDVIYGSGNGAAPVDDGWFAHAVPGELLGEPVRFCPPEEVLWSKAFVMEQDRYDGADVAHLLLALGPQLDWQRLLDRFGPHWWVLYSHLILFGFTYPSERGRVLAEVMREFGRRLQGELEAEPPADRVCRGTLLAAAQYLPDVERWGFADARLQPYGPLTAEQAAEWTRHILEGR